MAARSNKSAPNGQGISFVVPMYNEQGAIADTLTRLHAQLTETGLPFEILAVDDCSVDDTVIAATETGLATIVRHPANSGYGHALKSGIANAQYNWIGIVDADGTYDIESIPALVEALNDGFDMVVATRENIRELDKPVKGLFRRLYIGAIELLVGGKVPDPNSGLRLFTRELVWGFLPFLCNTFSFTTSLTVFALGGSHFVKFIPTKYEERVGISKVRHFRDSLRTIQLIVQGVTFYNPIKLYILLAVTHAAIIGLPALLLAICWPAFALLYAAVGTVPWLLLGLGALADIFRISTIRKETKAELYGGQVATPDKSTKD